MIQNESLPVWHYGRGRAIITGRITYLGGDPEAIDDPNVYRIEGPLRWQKSGTAPDIVIWRADLDAVPITPIVYASADLLSSTAGSESTQAMVRPLEGSLPNTPPFFTFSPPMVLVTLRNINNPETGADLAVDQALCVTAIVSQTGPLKYRSVPILGAPPVPPPAPAPAPRPPPDDDGGGSPPRIP